MPKVFKYSISVDITDKRVNDMLYWSHQYKNDLLALKNTLLDTLETARQKYYPEYNQLVDRIAEMDAIIVEVLKRTKDLNRTEKRQANKDTGLSQLKKDRKALNKELTACRRQLKLGLDSVDLGPEVAELRIVFEHLSDMLGPNNSERRVAAAEYREALIRAAKLRGYDYLAEKGIASEEYRQGVHDLKAKYALRPTQYKSLQDSMAKATRFKSYTGEGRLFQQTANWTTDKVFESGSYIQIIGTGKAREAVINLGDGNPVLLPICYHRELPAGQPMSGFSLVAKRVGSRREWSLQIVCECPHPAVANNDHKIAFDMGWRRVDGGLKVCHHKSDTGVDNGALILPQKWIDQQKMIHGLQSVLDKKFDEIRDTLKAWLKTHDCPAWLKADTEHLSKWRSHKRLVKLTLKWRANRFDGDTEMYELLDGTKEGAMARRGCGIGARRRKFGYLPGQEEHIQMPNGWRCWQKHIYEWMENLRRKSIAWRNDIYRKYVANLSRRYGIAIVEDADWSKTIRRAEADKIDNDFIHKFQGWASPGILRTFIEERFAETRRVDPKGTTYTCHKCGTYVDFGGDEWAACSCGEYLNRDENSCCNQLVAPATKQIVRSKSTVVPKTPAPLDPYVPWTHDKTTSDNNACSMA